MLAQLTKNPGAPGKVEGEAVLEEEEEPLHQDKRMAKAYPEEGVAEQLQEKY